MCRIGDDNLGTLIVATALVIGANHHQSCQLAMCAGTRVQRKFTESRQFGQQFLQAMIEPQCLLACLDGLQGMQPGKALQSSNLFVDDGIILHRTRAQRIEAVVDAKVIMTEVGIVANDSQFITLRQLRLLFTSQHSRNLVGSMLIGILGQGVALASCL